jgi:hypothetical protein
MAVEGLMEKKQADIFECISADHESIRGVMDALLDGGTEIRRKRAVFRRMLPLFRAHTYGVEQSLMMEGLHHEPLRPLVLRCLEEHELAEVSLHRMGLAVSDEVWEARMEVFCHMLLEHLGRTEKTFPQLRKALPEEIKEELAMKYLDTRNKFNLNPIREVPVKPGLVYDQAGKIGYIVAWILGVPAWILLLVFLIRGH